jgi:plasmid replication initiation protein
VSEKKLNISCALCNKQMDTKKEKVRVTVEWVLKELIKLNEINDNKEFPRVVKICNNCYVKKLVKKPEKEDLFWEFSKEI